MKNLITLLLIIGLSFSAFSQISNADFELWSSPTSSYEDPDDWQTPNATIESFFSTNFTVAKSTDMHGGSFAAELMTRTVSGAVVPGAVTNGNINISVSPPGVSITGGSPMSSSPTALTGWYKYTPGPGGDTAIVVALLSKWDTVSMSRDTVALATFMVSDTVSTYTMFTATFAYVSSSPDTLLITVLSSAAGLRLSGSVGSTFLLDDVGVTGNNRYQPALLSHQV